MESGRPRTVSNPVGPDSICTESYLRPRRVSTDRTEFFSERQKRALCAAGAPSDRDRQVDLKSKLSGEHSIDGFFSLQKRSENLL